MKKYALCLSGDPRYIQEPLDSIVNNIILPNNCDIFAHFWTRTKESDSYKTLKRCVTNNYVEFMADNCLDFISKIKEKIHFTQLQTELHPEFPILMVPNDLDYNEHYKAIKRHNIFFQSQYYSVYKANCLKQTYEEKHNFKYDGVIRLRTDIMIEKIIKFEDYDLSKFYATMVDENYIYDQMTLSNSRNTDIFSDFYNHMKEIYDEDNIPGVAAAELHIAYYLKKYGVQITNTTFGQTWKHSVRNIIRMF